ncbi:hypothetical protein SEA_A3WALLY_235 [Microbacterium phage A3Wally]|nr:hypothetical protein SEA_A3WALLY_235 [Microbacterium phage A3Wally]
MSFESNVTSLAVRLGTEFKTIRTQLTGNASGALTGLTTDAKSSLIAAINELDAAIEALASAEGGATIIDGAPVSTSVWSSAKTDAEIDTAVSAAVASLLDSAPGALDTLNELAAALGDDPNFSATLTGQIAAKADANHTHTASQITDFATAVDGRVAAAVPQASTTVAGKTEYSTDAEAIAGTSVNTAVTPAALAAVVGDSTENFVTTFETALI